MAAPDAFGSWLDAFEREVDASIGKTAPAKSPQARSAAAAFDRWWGSENEGSVIDGADQRELALAGDASQRLDRLTRERKSLEDRLAALERQNASLREAETRLGAALNDAQTRASREREQLDARVAALESEGRALAQQNSTLEQSRQFLQKSFVDSQAEYKSLRAELSLAQDRAAAAEREALEARKRTSELELKLAALREERAAKDGALEELRRQASVYQQRLVTAKEQTDADVALLRQETKMFLEEFRILANTMRSASKEQP